MQVALAPAENAKHINPLFVKIIAKRRIALKIARDINQRMQQTSALSSRRFSNRDGAAHAAISIFITGDIILTQIITRLNFNNH